MANIFEHVLMAGFHGSIVIAAILILRLFLGKAPKKFLCLLWLLAFLRLLMPFEIRCDLSLQPQPLPPAVQEYQPETPSELSPLDWEIPASPAVPVTPIPEPAPPKAPVALTAILGWIWLAVMLGFTLYSSLAYEKLKRRVRDACRIRGGWESDRIETAFILGYLRPKIYIPMGMDPQTRGYILAHERTHLEKGDHWLKLLGYLALSVHWFNPLVWAAYLLLCKDMELACDERVVRFMDLNERKAYSMALLQCSTNHRHLAACPVAFGEVGVKDRIKTVLHYRRPTFWITLLGILAIAFVTVCLMTSPSEKPETPSGEGNAAAISPEDIPWTVRDAVRELQSRDSYYVTFTQRTTYQGETLEGRGHRRKSGENGSYIVEQSNATPTSYLMYDGRFAGVQDGSMVWMSDSAGDVDAWLDFYAPNLEKVEAATQVDDRTVSFRARCIRDQQPAEYTGDFTCTFREDGSLSSLRAVTSWFDKEGQEVVRDCTFEVREEDPRDTARILEEAADSAIPLEAYNRLQSEKQLVAGVPSNTTEYDRDFALGAERMGWELMDGSWFMKFGAENVNQTSLELVWETSVNYDGSALEGSVRSSDACMLEVLKDGEWELYEETARIPVHPTAITAGTRISVDWMNLLGHLPGGFYRVGMEYIFEDAEGNTDTQYCYAKFRLYDGDTDTLVSRCRQAVRNLLNADTYHITHTTWNQLGTGEGESAIEEQIWKNGADYLSRQTISDRATHEVRSLSGSAIRDGVGYNIQYNNNDVQDVASQSVAAHIDREHMEFWAGMMELYDSQITRAEERDNEIRIHMRYDFSGAFDSVEMDYGFDRQGRLIYLLQVFVKANGTRVLEAQMTADYDDPEGVREMSASGEEAVIRSFDYTEEASRNEGKGVRRKNFLNTEPVNLNNAVEVLHRAIRDCTLPAVGEYEPGTNLYDLFYDEETRMWKVEFTASWDDRIYEAVYMDEHGVTQSTVTEMRNTTP